jgi:catechol 2,3-dioxygenase-like lactoylglutathione lyase family enzyme
MVHIEFLALRCADLTRSTRFYELLGLEFVEEQHGSGPRHLSCNLGGTVLELYPARGSGERLDLATIGLTVTDLVATQTRIQDADLPIKRPVDADALITTDPDGRRIRLAGASES